ncbi:MAG: HEPN domain-containing protein [Methanothrix sp.]|jgi:HEPN domain-containing protein|nr:HEPN domain-containing protein [Methanothrix sp.]
MRDDVKNWWEQAKHDLYAAKFNFDGGLYDVSAFYCHQSIEKGLKALCILKNKESPGKTHSLIFLGRSCELPERYYPFLKRLTPEFVLSRYPDISGELPFLLYDREWVENYLKKADEVLSWIESQMSK